MLSASLRPTIIPQVKTRLDVTLSHLRRAHCYCLFCGHRYASDEDLERSCPGEQEDDH